MMFSYWNSYSRSCTGLYRHKHGHKLPNWRIIAATYNREALYIFTQDQIYYIKECKYIYIYIHSIFWTHLNRILDKILCMLHLSIGQLSDGQAWDGGEVISVCSYLVPFRLACLMQLWKVVVYQEYNSYMYLSRYIEPLTITCLLYYSLQTVMDIVGIASSIQDWPQDQVQGEASK